MPRAAMEMMLVRICGLQRLQPLKNLARNNIAENFSAAASAPNPAVATSTPITASSNASNSPAPQTTIKANAMPAKATASDSGSNTSGKICKFQFSFLARFHPICFAPKTRFRLFLEHALPIENLAPNSTEFLLGSARAGKLFR